MTPNGCPDPERPLTGSSAPADAPLTISPARSPSDLARIRELFRAYADALEVDLSFQRFEDELANLPGRYGPPGGCLLLARVGTETVGCVGVRPLEPGVAELKRLYVRPGGRARGTGRALVQAALDWARTAGYQRIRLDTLETMADAQRLYRKLGFNPCEPFGDHPVPGTLFLERWLDRPPL